MSAPLAASPLPRVHVIDDDDSFRTSLIRMLQLSGLATAGYSCAGEFLLAERELGAGCILLDISMPGPSGIELLQVLARSATAPPVIFVTGRDDVFTGVSVMKAGAFDYIVKPASAERVVPAVRRALQVDAERRAARARLLELRCRFALLTATEQSIFQGVIHNRLNKQLAGDLGVCERTIKAQRARMMRKLCVTTVPELVRVAKTLEGSAGKSQPARPPAARSNEASPLCVSSP